MFAATKESLSRLQRSRPGQRFQDHYRAAHRPGRESSTLMRILRCGLAFVAVVIGVILVFVPGPAVLFFALAGALLAPESRRLAAGLDWTELKLSAGLKWAKRTWAKFGWFARCLVVLVTLLLAIPVGLAVWNRFFA